MSNREVETIAFLDPETTKQVILAFDFDDKNRVKDVFLYTKEDNRPMKMVERITPSQGQDSHSLINCWKVAHDCQEQSPEARLSESAHCSSSRSLVGV